MQLFSYITSCLPTLQRASTWMRFFPLAPLPSMRCACCSPMGWGAQTTCYCPLYHPGIYVICLPAWWASPPPGTKTGWRSWLVGCGGEVSSRMMFCLSLTWLQRLIGRYLGPLSSTWVMCWEDISQLLRPPTIIFAPGSMVSPSQKRILVILCLLKGFIVIDFLVWGLPGFLTYLRFVYIFPNSPYSKF